MHHNSIRSFVAAMIYAFSLTGNTLAQLPDLSAFEGAWEGAVVRENSMQSLRIDLAAKGSTLEGTFSIPDLGLYNEPLSEVTVTPPQISLRFLYGVFQATLHSDLQEMVGGNEKWNPPVRLHLRKTDLHPSWRYETVRFSNGGVELAGTLVLPAGVGPFPAAVIICGSYPQGRYDGKDAWGYRGWGETLAQRGVAALVYDKRGVGESTGDTELATFVDLAKDALAGVATLRQHSAIDPNRVGLVGISQGGWIAPIAAVEDPAVSFLILQVPPAVSVEQQEIDAVAERLSTEEAVDAGMGETDIAEARAYTREMFAVAYGRKTWAAFEPTLIAARRARWARFLELPAMEDDLAWWKRNEFDPTETLGKVQCPVLAMFGANDLLIPSKTNVPLWEQFFTDSGNRNLTVRIFPDAGHNCEASRRLVGDNWQWPSSFWVWPRKAPGFYGCISEWLVRQRIVPVPTSVRD